MFELGWGEILLCAVVALLVAGPEDVPRLMRAAGVFMGRLRRWGRSVENMLDGFIARSEAEVALSARDKENAGVPEVPADLEEDEPEYHPPETGGGAS